MNVTECEQGSWNAADFFVRYILSGSAISLIFLMQYFSSMVESFSNVSAITISWVFSYILSLVFLMYKIKFEKEMKTVYKFAAFWGAFAYLVVAIVGSILASVAIESIGLITSLLAVSILAGIAADFITGTSKLNEVAQDYSKSASIDKLHHNSFMLVAFCFIVGLLVVGSGVSRYIVLNQPNLLSADLYTFQAIAFACYWLSAFCIVYNASVKNHSFFLLAYSSIMLGFVLLIVYFLFSGFSSELSEIIFYPFSFVFSAGMVKLFHILFKD
mgnify:CR=1 FL=1